MFENDAKESLEKVMQSMDQLNYVFEKALERLRKEGVDEEDLGGLEKGVLAMKDAGRLYLTWSDHFIQRLNQVDGLGEMVDE